MKKRIPGAPPIMEIDVCDRCGEPDGLTPFAFDPLRTVLGVVQDLYPNVMLHSDQRSAQQPDCAKLARQMLRMQAGLIVE